MGKLFAWPHEKGNVGCEDMYCSSGFEIEDQDWESLIDFYGEMYEEEMGEPLFDADEVAFWVVGEEVHKAAKEVPFGDSDSETMKNMQIRMNILRSGAVKTVCPV